MSKYKLIAFDMDGTLLNSEKRISERTLESVNRAFDAGKEVILQPEDVWQSFGNILSGYRDCVMLSAPAARFCMM